VPPKNPFAPLRDGILIFDPAASGRRLVRRQLAGLPYQILEAHSPREAVKICAARPVGLIIMDADLTEAEAREALHKIQAEDAQRGRALTPALALLAHESQAERMLSLGCVECQVKFVSRADFQRLILRLCPHPEAPFLHLPPSNENYAPQQDPPGGQDAARAASGRIPMLDLIVHSLEADEQALREAAAGAGTPGTPPWGSAPDTPTGGATPGTPAKGASPFGNPSGGLSSAELVQDLREHLRNLEQAEADMDLAALGRAASGLARQGSGYGLDKVERMAVCVYEAVQSQEEEAAFELAQALAERVRRHIADARP
ncbi:MAG: hypothetical protein LBD82_00760, partial [Deltaproteobacteria bacterium]|jgi:CheY-like chemotaxis protein|nr:hypothetical protein [Deltaproteobacteria bacterium]